MKLYKRFKGMSKSTKIGLVSSAVYVTSAFAIPAFANVEMPGQSVEHTVEQPVVFQPVDVEQITTTEQANQVFNEQLKLYAEDKKMNPQEITNLGEILERKKSLLGYQKQPFEEQMTDLEDKELTAKIEEVRTSIDELNSKKVETPKLFEKIRQALDEKILCHYPGLIQEGEDASYSVVYSASDGIEEKLKPVMKSLVAETDKVLRECYNDMTLELMSEKDVYTVKDILTFHKALYKERKAIRFQPSVSEEKQRLEEELKALEEKKSQLVKINKAKVKELEQKISAVNSELREAEYEYRPFERYLEAKENINSFIEKHADLTKYFGLNVLSFSDDVLLRLKGVKIGQKVKEFNQNNKEAIIGLEEHFKGLGYEVSVEGLKNPAKTKFPWPWWATTMFGIVFPIPRNILSAGFIKRRVDGGDLILGGIELYCAILFLDSLFPLMYPIRVFGVPFILEPFRKVTGWRTLK